jgi:hypothetical protein
MKSINAMIEQQAHDMGVKYIDSTSIWDAHHTSIESSRNVKHLLVKAFTNKHTEQVLVVIGSIGRSQHSESRALFFDVTSRHDGITDIELAGLSNIRWNAVIFYRSDVEGL